MADTAMSPPTRAQPFLARRLSLILLLLQLVSLATAQNCSPSNPCEIGCCSIFGFCGLGPDFCAPDVCAHNCERKADCDPGGFGEEYSLSKTCPLNVCCSKFGFCGTTKDFCGDKPVERPSCDVSGQGFERVVGYYEGWSPNRPCNKFYPEQIPKGIYTHLNFAFATIDPVTFEVKLAAPGDHDLLKRLVALKGGDPNLKVLIAIGGWTFNDEGPTATTFSDIARSAENTARFGLSLLQFMTTYNLDGVDLDWEYPEAEDRSGRPEDYANFPLFLWRLRLMFRLFGRKSEVSITIPASFWYLRHFDLPALQGSVDFFNVMTYDFHGTWDMGNKWVGPYLNSHTNLTEVKEALDLLWRNKVKPDKVVLGMAFYGRSFTVVDPACTAPGCVYGSGSPQQACSREVSVMLNSEIDDVRARTGATPVLDTAAAVKKLVWDSNQWVTYDDADTFLMRANFARSQCLGGVMVWAVSHDNKNATYNKAFGTAAGKKFQAIAMTTDGTETTKDEHLQCKWTGCLEQCPPGWTRMMRQDGGARDGEYMTDNQGCPSGQHQLCCPPNSGLLPTCGWYDHNNGACSANCPITHMEIGSNSAHCRHGYQAACCSVASQAMHLHNTCGWSSNWPDCNSGSCRSGMVEYASSMSGSGGAFCNEMGWRDIWGYPSWLPREERKLCCREDIPEQRWHDCKWYDRYGIFHMDWPSDACIGQCPENKVRVAKEIGGESCSSGSRVRCCTAAYHTITKRNSVANEELETLLERFFDSPICVSNHNSDEYRYQERLSFYIKNIMYETPDATRIAIWDDIVGSQYDNLKVASLQTWAKNSEEALLEGSTKMPRAIMCGMAHYNNLIGGVGVTCPCSAGSSGSCGDIDFLKRRVFDSEFEYGGPNSTGLVRREGESYRTISVTSPITGTVVTFVLSMMAYRSSGEWWDSDAVWNRCVDFATAACSSAAMTLVPSMALNRDGLNTEHPVERQSLVDFVRLTILGQVPTHLNAIITSQFGPIPPDFWTATGFANVPAIFERWPVADPQPASVRRLFSALGSTNLEDTFVMVNGVFNSVKGAVWGYNDPYVRGDMSDLVDANDFINFLTRVRTALAVVGYMGVPVVQTAYGTILHRIRWVLAVQQYLHWLNTGVQVEAVGRFDEWWIAHLRTMSYRLQDWTTEVLDYAASRWGTRIDVMQNVDALRLFMQGIDNDLAVAHASFWPRAIYQITQQPPTQP